jgi:hypothetical protein
VLVQDVIIPELLVRSDPRLRSHASRTSELQASVTEENVVHHGDVTFQEVSTARGIFRSKSPVIPALRRLRLLVLALRRLNIYFTSLQLSLPDKLTYERILLLI